MMTDPLADMLTRIRNGNRIERPAVDIPATSLKKNVAQVLKDEGFILDFQVGSMLPDEQGQVVFKPHGDVHITKCVMRVFLKYGPEGEKVIRHIQRVSTPGLRIYRRGAELAPVLEGLGIAVVSTNRGVMSDRQARSQKLGGEVLCTVW